MISLESSTDKTLVMITSTFEKTLIQWAPLEGNIVWWFIIFSALEIDTALKVAFVGTEMGCDFLW